jgi:hypothetical protein
VRTGGVAKSTLFLFCLATAVMLLGVPGSAPAPRGSLGQPCTRGWS